MTLPRRLPLALPLAVAGSVVASSLALGAAPAVASHDNVPPGRTMVTHTVQPGDTATGLATRYRAWTRELIAVNHLGGDARMRVGQRLRIPVVTAVAQRSRSAKKGAPARSAQRPAAAKRPATRAGRSTPGLSPSRERVRRTIADTARRHGVDPHLALAVAWQESGWQMGLTSEAGAIGAMQVLPGTGRWMSLYTGGPLRLRDLQDNATAGVVLLKVLDGQTSSTRHQLAAYYQGLGAVREHGLYDETVRYVKNVRAIRSRLAAGQSPAG
ncbi:lytic transglycosylase domain-containing protein [Nocardioides sp.]|uniref:lytic transglycosylase domain-containing protein n=1 Tax=Nocardioides sp. TaxID=35761 RepID=UPI002733B011|nr:lytic transglycosylase domain-containing protein [Nocardioides sp.]MDP3893814.1 lytic transglycosylase domain-containing protein [Nocardioides sp.]